MEWGLALLLGYALGSVPFGLILTRMTGAGDLRAIGSGNIGATNVLRTGRKGLAAATLLLDMGKGLAAVLLAWRFFPAAVELAAFGAFVGHCFPVWLGFKGGKGVATMMGVSLGLAWPIGLAYAAAWLGLLAITRISSLAGMTAAVVAPIAALATGHERFVPVLGGLAVLVLYLHRANIARLMAGTEPKVGGGRQA
jgi:glycerol-3-phosphate acyltransferase PlsY